ncbi:metallophosphoesterase [Ahrensia sp. R2A130]|uniref:metallophosphoesterase n=1 Tax=Ahrensia sp. R2A130 TaxID=744979 RepID=UPI0001E0BC7E|nr:metallophosphoesterase [Ahrensia sp. R2A130]EFL89456.1 metallophosphoesterase [Ahrensia sp. R2A130]
MARLLHLTDLHVVAPGTLASGILDTPRLVKDAVDRVLERENEIGPLDAVLVTGDISDDGSAGSYRFAREQLDRLRLPLLPIPGNHDAREAMRDAFSDLPVIPAGDQIDWTFDLGTTRIIGLDTLVEGQGAGRLLPSSLAHLRHAISGFEGTTIIVALHHPPLKTGIAFMDAISLVNTEELAPILASFEGDLRVLAGHVHGVHIGNIGRHPVMTAPSICSAFPLDRRRDAPVGFSTGQTGYAVIDTAADGLWSTISLAPSDGPHPF